MRSIRILALMKVSFLPLDLLKYIYIYILVLDVGKRGQNPNIFFLA